MKKRLLVTMLATSIVATMLTGCGGKLSEEQGISTEAQTTIEQTAEPSGGEKEVTATIEEVEPVAKFQNGEPYSTRYLDILEPTDGGLLHTGARYFGMDNYGYDNHQGFADKDFLQMGFIDWERQGSVTVENGIETLNMHFEFNPENIVMSGMTAYFEFDEVMDMIDRGDPLGLGGVNSKLKEEYQIPSSMDKEEIESKIREYAQVTAFAGDIIMVDAYTGICGDKDFYKNYEVYTKTGFDEKAKAGVSYSTEFLSNNKTIQVEYVYGMNGDKPCVDVTARYPEGYDGLKLMILGKDIRSITGDYIFNYMFDEGDKVCDDPWDPDYMYYHSPAYLFGGYKKNVVFATYGAPVELGSSESDQTMQTMETWADMILHDASYAGSEPFYDALKDVCYICDDISSSNKDAGIGYCDFEDEESETGITTYNQYYNTLFNMRIDGCLEVVDPIPAPAE